MKSVLRAKIVRSVKASGEKTHRRVFYAVAGRPFTSRGIPCLTPSEKCMALIEQLGSCEHPEDALGHLWDCLGFVYNGKPPQDWYRGLRARPVASVAEAVVELIREMNRRNIDAVRQSAWDLVHLACHGAVPKGWHREIRMATLNPILLLN